MHAQMTRHAFAAPAARPSLRSSRPRPCVAPRATPPRPTEADPNNPLDQVHVFRDCCSGRRPLRRLLRVWHKHALVSASAYPLFARLMCAAGTLVAREGSAHLAVLSLSVDKYRQRRISRTTLRSQCRTPFRYTAVSLHAIPPSPSPPHSVLQRTCLRKSQLGGKRSTDRECASTCVACLRRRPAASTQRRSTRPPGLPPTMTSARLQVHTPLLFTCCASLPCSRACKR